MSDIGDLDLQGLYVKPRAVGGTANIKLTLTVNGDEMATWSGITTYGELLDEFGVRGVVFTQRDLTDEEDLEDALEWLRKVRSRQRGSKSKPA